MENEWCIAGEPEFFSSKGFFSIAYHKHNDYWFLALGLKNGLMCGLCGTLIPEHIKLQLKLIGNSLYESYPYCPGVKYRVRCIYDNKMIPIQLNRDGFWFSHAVSREHREKIESIVNFYNHIWKDILL